MPINLVEEGIPRIALVGKMRSGKTTVASAFAHNHGFTISSFGSSLKKYAEEILSESDVYPTECKYKDCPFSDEPLIVGKSKPRALYQDFGQAMRALDSNVWIRHTANAINWQEERRSHVGTIIDDLRQPNEYKWAKANGFVIIRVNANEDTRLSRANAEGDAFSIDDLRHETEMHVDDFEVDYEIWNDDGDSLAELERNIDVIMSEINHVA